MVETTGHRKSGRGPKALTHSDVSRAALEFIDREGLASFGVRALAQAMGVSTATLYWHVGGKEDLLASAAVHVFEHIDLPSLETAPWDDALVQVARSCRRSMQDHPNVVPVIGSVLVDTPPFRLVEMIVKALESAGVGGAQMLSYYNAYVGFLLGFVTVELSTPPMGDGSGRWAREFAHGLNDVDAASYPALARNMENLAGRGFMLRWDNHIHPASNLVFEEAIGIFIAGLRSRLTQ